jgi:hypothetical protein
MRRNFVARACLLSVLVLSAASNGALAAPVSLEQDEAVPVDSKPFKAKLVSADSHWHLTFETSTGERKVFPAADLCWWGAWAAPSQDTQLLLVDGSLLMADLVALDKERVVVDSSSGGTLKLPLEVVAGIVIHPSADAQRGDKLRDSLLGDSPLSGSRPAENAVNRNPADSPRIPQTDRLILANGDDLAGEITGWSDDSLTVKTTAGEIHVRTDKVAAAAFNPALAARPRIAEVRAWVGFRDGSRLLVSTMESAGTKIHLTLAMAPAKMPRITVGAADIVALQPLGGKAVYLSDLKPAGYQQIPFLKLTWPYHADRNVLGTMLRAGGRLYLKGLGMHSAARLTYDVPAGYRTLAAEVAIDDQTAGHGSAVVRVYTDDGSGHPQLNYDGPIIRGGAAPLPIAVDLTGAKRVNLLVDFADCGDVESHVDWLNARLLK